jgi:hypothetical protein
VDIGKGGAHRERKRHVPIEKRTSLVTGAARDTEKPRSPSRRPKAELYRSAPYICIPYLDAISQL